MQIKPLFYLLFSPAKHLPYQRLEGQGSLRLLEIGQTLSPEVLTAIKSSCYEYLKWL